MKGVDEKSDGVHWWFSHMIKKMENDRILRRAYVGECAVSCIE